MVSWCHEFEQALGDGEGHGSLTVHGSQSQTQLSDRTTDTYCSMDDPWKYAKQKESDTKDHIL